MTAVAQDNFVGAGNIDFAEMRAALRTVGAAFAALVHQVSEEEAARQVPYLKWTVAETAAHMLTILKRGTEDRRRADSLAGLADLNDLTIAEISHRHPADLATAIASESATLGKILERFDAERATSTVVNLHAGVRTSLSAALSYILMDLMVHGYDIAVATGAPWHIDGRHAELDLHAALPLLEPWVKCELVGATPTSLAITFPHDPDAIVVNVGRGWYRAQNYPVALLDGEYAEVDPVDALLAVSGRKAAISPDVERLASLFDPL